MIKQLLTPLLISSYLHAEGIDPGDLKSIYMEAALFVTVFGLMSIVSFVISKKHAKQNALKNLQKKEEESAKNAQAIPIEQSEESEDKRTEELSKMLKDGLITKKEFQILKDNSKNVKQ